MADTAAEDPVAAEADTEDVEITEIARVEVGTVVDEMVEDTEEDRAVMEETEEAVEVVVEMAVDVTIAEKMVTSPEIAQLLPKADHATNAIRPAISAGTAPPSPRLRFRITPNKSTNKQTNHLLLLLSLHHKKEEKNTKMKKPFSADHTTTLLAQMDALKPRVCQPCFTRLMPRQCVHLPNFVSV